MTDLLVSELPVWLRSRTLKLLLILAVVAGVVGFAPNLRAQVPADTSAKSQAQAADEKSAGTPGQFKIPHLDSPVMDEAGVLDSATQAHLDAAIRYLREQGGAQLTVLTVPTLGGLSIEEASIKVTDQWKLGNKKEDRGVLFLIAPNERKMRIEVGQGLEGVLTDAASHRIIEESVTPLFKSGDLNSGVIVGVFKIAQTTDLAIDLRSRLEGGVRRAPRQGQRTPGGLVLIFIIVFLLISFLSRGSRGGRGGPFFFGGGGFGGGFGGGGGSGGWGGGGGGFSGGGASGGW